LFVFFFSSRRRHTRSKRDWSSDVCSSDCGFVFVKMKGGRSGLLDKTLIELVAKDIQIKQSTIEKVVQLLEEGNTIPFIARYRKEVTGGLDEVEIKQIHDEWHYAVQLKERKEEVIRLIDEQGKLTEELQANIEKATKLQ